jgi:hypothetical protein
MIATGCIMARICHTNNCPVGVASQREELRARFPGVPGDLVNFFLYVAEEVSALILTRSLWRTLVSLEGCLVGHSSKGNFRCVTQLINPCPTSGEKSPNMWPIGARYLINNTPLFNTFTKFWPES